MNKKLLIVGISVLLVTVYLSGCTEQTSIENQPPIASVSANPTSGEVPLTVVFVGAGSDSDGTVESYCWDFGDGLTSDIKNPSHTFHNDGAYTVILTITDDDDTTATDTVMVVAYQIETEKNYDDTDFTIWVVDGMSLIADDIQEILDSSLENAEFAFRLIERDSGILLNEIDDYDEFYSSDLLLIKLKFKSALWDFKDGGIYGLQGVKYLDTDAINTSVDYLKSGSIKYNECRDLIFEYLGIFIYPLEVEE